MPPNTTATVRVPSGNPAQVYEGTQPVSKAAGVEPARPERGAAVFRVGSGTYRFTTAAP